MNHENALQLEDRWNWLSWRQSCDETQCHVPSTKRKWRKLLPQSDGPEGRCSHTLTALSDECLLLVGGGRFIQGDDDTFQHFNDLWMLNALTAEWRQLECPNQRSQAARNYEDPESYWGMTFGPPRRGHMAAAYQSKYLIVFGGIADGDVELNDLWVLHVPTLEWKKMKFDQQEDTPPPRRGGIACCYQDYFYLIGGHATEELLVWKLGPLSSTDDSWRWSIQPAINKTFLHKRAPKWPTVSLGARPLQPVQFAASALVGNKLWIFGGLERHVANIMVPTNLLYRLDMESWEWSVLYVPKNAPCPRFFHGMTSIGKFLIIMGGIGMVSQQEEVTDIALDDDDIGGAIRQCTIFDLFCFDTDNLLWYQCSPNSHEEEWPRARNAFALTRLGNRHLVVFGGGVYQQNYFQDTFALEFELPSLPVTQDLHSEEDNHLSADLGNTYRSGILSDVTLVVGSRRFPVHKAILASRCDFFQTMFAGPYSEASVDEVRFDALPEAVDFVLRFLYTNHVDTDVILADADLVSSVLTLVDFWDVQKLLEILEVALSQELQKESTDPFELIAFAKSHNCQRLALRCLEFCKQRWDALKSKDVDPDLAAEIGDYVNSLL